MFRIAIEPLSFEKTCLNGGTTTRMSLNGSTTTKLKKNYLNGDRITKIPKFVYVVVEQLTFENFI